MSSAKYFIHIKGTSFYFRREGEAEGVRFSTLQEAIKHAESQPRVPGVKVLVMSEDGVAVMTLDL